MNIKLSPQFGWTERLTISKEGHVLTLNDVTFDFTQMPEGSTLPSGAIESAFFVSGIEMTNNEMNFTLLMPLTENGSRYTEDQLFPKDLLNVQDGVIVLPDTPSEVN